MNSFRKAFVIGHPIAQSRSPMIHGYWLKTYGIDGSYEATDVAPDAFADFIDQLRNGAFAGGNVTIPHKQAAFAAADMVTDRARRLEAVNTLWMHEGKLHGDNTDILGFCANLDQTLGAGWDQHIRNVLVIGAGGAARGVVAGLLSYPSLTITIVNRTLDKIAPLVTYDPARIRAAAWQNLSEKTAKAELIVNTTSLGMTGYPPLDIDFSKCDKSCIVADIVYNPLITPMLQAARQHDLRVVDGLGMLLHQAVPGFARWFGVTPEVTPELRDLIVADLEKSR